MQSRETEDGEVTEALQSFRLFDSLFEFFAEQNSSTQYIETHPSPPLGEGFLFQLLWR